MGGDCGDLVLVGGGERGHLPLGVRAYPLGGLFGLLGAACNGGRILGYQQSRVTTVRRGVPVRPATGSPCTRMVLIPG